jgi:hypothetical protein
MTARAHTPTTTSTRPALAADATPRVIAVPGVLDGCHDVVRVAGESDADYEARCRLVTLLLGAAQTS